MGGFQAPSGQDWEPVVLSKRKPKATSNKTDVNTAMRTGDSVETVKKFNAGTNKKAATDKDARKLDDETEAQRHETVSFELKRAIQQARQAKKMTQKALAQAINEKQSVINDYEQGKAIPTNQVISKMERVLGAKLRQRNK